MCHILCYLGSPGFITGVAEFVNKLGYGLDNRVFDSQQ